MQAGSGPIESKIPANLRANFSSQYLSQEVNGRTRKDVSACCLGSPSHVVLCSDHHVTCKYSTIRGLLGCAVSMLTVVNGLISIQASQFADHLQRLWFVVDPGPTDD